MRHNQPVRLALCLLALWAALAPILGCGGGGGGAAGTSQPTAHGKGKATFTVKWPARTSKVIPAAANSILVSVTQGTTFSMSQVLMRPVSGSLTTSVTFNQLPVGTVMATATAYPSTDGTNSGGVAQAAGATTLEISQDQTTAVNLTLNSTITQIILSSTTFTLASGQTTMLTATAEDANNNMVLVTPTNLVWSTASVTVATATSPGATSTVTGVAPGSTMITVREVESGITASATVTVFPVVLVSDTGNKRVVSLNGIDMTGFTTYSTGLAAPAGLARDSSTRIYIADSTNNNITRIDNITGANMTVYSSGGLSSPHGLAIDSQNRIYVADTGNNRILRTDDFNNTNAIATLPSVGLNAPQGVAVDSAGHIYIADSGNSRIVELSSMTDPTGTAYTVPDLVDDTLTRPSAVALDSTGRIYIAGGNDAEIVRIDNITGANQTFYGGAGTSLNTPSGISLDNQNRIYITDSADNHIIRMDDISGTNLTTYGSSGSGSGQFSGPTCILAH